MADDINMPNLVSHLQVNLQNTSGIVADATRQGSSVGAAVGRGMQNTLRDALSGLPEIELDANSSQLDRDLARVRGDLQSLADQRIGVDISIEEALRRMAELEPHLDRLTHEHPNVTVRATVTGALADLQALRQAAQQADDTDVEIDVEVDTEPADRLGATLGRLAGMAGPLRGVAASIGTLGAALGAAVPVAAGLAAAVAQIAPAAGVAVSAQLALRQATAAVQLGMTGVEDAVTAALDPDRAEEFEEALKKLAPEARAFATAVRELAPQFRELQQAVQNTLFTGLAEEMERTATAVMPILKAELTDTAGALNAMASGVASAARGLAKDGTLGQAMGSASAGLHNLSGVPGTVATSLGQIAAAAGPSFERLTAAAGGAAADIGTRLGQAFESGAMQDAIEQAISLIGDLADVAGNVFGIVSEIFGAAEASGGGFLNTLKEITGSIREAFASPEVQAGLQALFRMMAQLAQTAGPLLATALRIIGQIFEQLGPPVETVIEALGDALAPVLDELGPLLVTAAKAVGVLVTALAPLLPPIGRLVAALLPALQPLLNALIVVFQALAPVVGTLAEILERTLTPILDELPGIITPLANLLANNLVTVITILGDLLVALAPSLVSLGQSFARLMVAVAPLIEIFARLMSEALERMVPLITPVIGIIGRLAAMCADDLATAVTQYAVPALRKIVEWMRTAKEKFRPMIDAVDWIVDKVSGAFEWLSDHLVGNSVIPDMINDIVWWFAGLPSRAWNALSSLAGNIAGRVRDAGARMVAAVREKIDDVVSRVRGMPGRAASALGDLGSRLWTSGRALIQGFVDGIKSKIGDVVDAVKDTVNRARDYFPFSPAKKGPFSGRGYTTYSGAALIRGFEEGIASRIPALRAQLNQLATLPQMSIPLDMAMPRAGAMAGVYAGTANQSTTNHFNLYGGDASPDGILRALTWRGLVGRTA
ncbi:hypothetical protein ACFSJS_22535 [Streptomyces desertarenae]|uniref:Phage tail protein n=1 Tax=Streptomyces desertarenae TaxID=2666184 RepID=A0ABW4PSL0_9ACTN